MMKPGAAETAPLLQRDETLISKPKPGAIAAAVRQAKRGVGVFGVALALSGVLVAIGMASPDATKKRASVTIAVRRGVQEIFVDSSLDTSIARRHAIAAASSRCLIRGDSAQAVSPRDAFAASRETPNVYVSL